MNEFSSSTVLQRKVQAFCLCRKKHSFQSLARRKEEKGIGVVKEQRGKKMRKWTEGNTLQGLMDTDLLSPPNKKHWGGGENMKHIVSPGCYPRVNLSP